MVQQYNIIGVCNLYTIVRGNVVDIIIVYFINYFTTIRFISCTYIDDCILKYRN